MCLNFLMVFVFSRTIKKSSFVKFLVHLIVNPFRILNPEGVIF